jgi:hypothetical protein
MPSNSTDGPGVTWEEAERQALLVGAALSFREKLQWLEEAERLGRRLLTCRVRFPDPANPGRWILVERPNPNG